MSTCVAIKKDDMCELTEKFKDYCSIHEVKSELVEEEFPDKVTVLKKVNGVNKVPILKKVPIGDNVSILKKVTIVAKVTNGDKVPILEKATTIENVNVMEKASISHQIKELIDSILPINLLKYGQWCEKLMKRYPPKYNANKFLYGGISEQLIKSLFEMSSHSCKVLGDDSFFNDIQIDQNLYMSVKTTKCDNDIIITNYKSKKPSDDDCFKSLINRIILVVNFYDKKIYFIVVSNIVQTMEQFRHFFISKDSNLTMKKTIFKKVTSNLCVNIPMNNHIKDDEYFNMYEKLASDIIQSC